ncbi:hypothetical protein KR009_005449 [Drosophila setifemur]|nr:hypothetical protein KR009_005449 [Drosophila setifemur]
MISNCTVLNINAHNVPEEDKHRFPTLSKPKSLGGYSVSPLGFFENNMDRMRYIVIPQANNFPFSLRNNEDRQRAKSAQEEDIDNMLLYIESKQQSFLKIINMRAEVNADIVCTSEVLELMMSAPYESKNGWALGVTRYRNTTYICRVDRVEPNPFDSDNLTRIMQADWLSNLHKRCLFDNGMGLPNANQSLEESSRFNGVFSFELNGKRILFDSPVLAEQSPYQFNGSYIWTDLQLRTSNMNRDEWSIHNRTEAIKWWIKCFLLGIESIYIAYRDENDLVHCIKKTAVRDLWKECENDWSPYVCANFMVRLLGCITQIMAPVDCPSTVYTFEFDANQGKVAYKAFEGRNEHTFVADWFRVMVDEFTADATEQIRRASTRD